MEEVGRRGEGAKVGWKREKKKKLNVELSRIYIFSKLRTQVKIKIGRKIRKY